MTSAFFSINKFVVIEYIYDFKTIDTSNSSFRKILNTYNDEVTIVNDNNSKLVTKNTADNTVVQLDNGKYALLDVDGPYFYPNLDPNIQISNINVSPALPVKYDKVKIHILSGYQFPELYGFAVSIYCRKNSNKLLRLANISYTRSDFDLLYFSPHPLKMAEFVYDRYIEFLIPSYADMLQQQIDNPGSTTILPYYLTDGEYLGTQKTIYCEYHNISNVIDTNGLRYFETDEAVRFVFNATDQFNLLVAQIFQATDGDYFEYYGEWDSEVIENFIYRLNSVAGNKFYIIHEINVIEQVGLTFHTTQSISHVQTNNFSKAFKFKPVLEFADTASSFSLEYTIRLYNSSDGKSIFKTSTLSSPDVAKFSKKSLKLNLGGFTNPIKIYNKRMDQPIYSISDNLTEIVKSKIVTIYMDVHNVVVRSDSDTDKSVNVTVKINPFDNLFKFDLTVALNNDQNSLKELEISQVSDYYIVFIKSDGSKNYIPEFKASNFSKTNGELAFKLTKTQSEEILKYTDKNFYVIAKNPDGIESVIFNGTTQ